MKEKIQHIKATFSTIPEPLQKQVYIRLGFTVVFLILFLITLFMLFDGLIVAPFIVLSIFNLISAVHVYDCAAKGNYAQIEGSCIEVNNSTIRKRIKSITLKTEAHTVQMNIKNTRQRIQKGMIITVFVSTNTPVYEKHGIMMLYNYIAIDMKGGEGNENSG